MLTLNRLSWLIFLTCFCAIPPLSIAQKTIDSSKQKVRIDWEQEQLINYPEITQIIIKTGKYIHFVDKSSQLSLSTDMSKGIQEDEHNKALDELLAFLEQEKKYKLVIRVKKTKELSKQCVISLYSYIFKNTNLKAQQLDIKPFTPKDAGYFWTFENEEIAISFDSY